MLGRLGLKLTSSGDIRNQGYMDVKHIVLAHFLFHLTDCLHERKGLNIAHSTTNFSDNNVSITLSSHIIYALLNFVSDMRNNLNGLAKVITTTLLVKNVPINLTSGNVRALGQININKTLIMTKIQVSLSTIVSYEYLTMLIRAHGTRVNINIWVKLLNGNVITAVLQQTAQ